LSNSVGVIDSGYRGEIQATFKKIQGVSNNALNNYKVGQNVELGINIESKESNPDILSVPLIAPKSSFSFAFIVIEFCCY
jgi:hypothetical protein